MLQEQEKWLEKNKFIENGSQDDDWVAYQLTFYFLSVDIRVDNSVVCDFTNFKYRSSYALWEIRKLIKELKEASKLMKEWEQLCHTN